MVTGEWTCACSVVNDGGVRFCEACGAEHQRQAPTAATSASTAPSAYREAPATLPTGAHHDDPALCTLPLCPAPACAAYIRESIAEAKRIAATPAWAERFGSGR